jgi:hypothetical protein
VAPDDFARHGKGAEGLSPEQLQRYNQAIRLPIVERINHGLLDDVPLTDVRQLFFVLDVNGDGCLDGSELRLFLQHIMDPPCPDGAIDELHMLAKEASGGRIGPEYFHSAISTGPLRRLLLEVSRQNEVAKKLKEQDDGKTIVDKEFMLARFEWRVSRDESFQTLPFSLVYLMVFISLVICHLRVWERQQVERAMEGHIIGWGYEYIGPYFQEHLPNLDQYYAWLETSGVQFAFGYCGATADKSVPAPFCEIAPRNLLVGDVKLKQTYTDSDSKSSVWLLHGAAAEAELTAHPTWENKTYHAALAQVKALRSSKWAVEKTATLELLFTTYNNQARFFAVNEVRVRFDNFGFATHTVYTWSVPAEPYNQKGALLADLIYVLILLKPFKEEIHEVLVGIRTKGWSGFVNYWAFWNVVDWFMIINGIALICVWLMIVLATEVGTLQDLLDDNFNFKILPTLSTSALEEIDDALRYVIILFRIMHGLMAANTMAIMLKFFKGFQANARLQVVTKTLIKASKDIFHFMVVFLAVFNGFVITGHILMGGDIIAFNSYGASFNTAFLCLMGDFGWYSDLTEKVEPLASGLPYTVVSFWFWSFMILALLILLNMLLAIIMENYAVVTEELNKMVDAPSLYVQTQRYIKRWKLARKGKWMGLHDVLLALEDENKNLHPDDIVTQESLQQAFPNMKESQAAFIVNWLQSDKKKAAVKEEEEEVVVRLKASQAFMATIAENLHTVSMSVLRCDSRIQQLQEAQKKGGSAFPSTLQLAPPPTTPLENPVVDTPAQTALAKGISGQLDSQQRVMKELCEQLAKQQRSSESMAKALAEVAQLVPSREPKPPPPTIQPAKPLSLPSCCGTADNNIPKQGMMISPDNLAIRR